MRKLLFLMMAGAAVLAAVPASATPPSPVTGTFTVVTLTPTGSRTAGGNTFTTLMRTASLSGTFTGTATDNLTVVTHRNGTTSVRGVGTCVCTVAGRTGTFGYRFTGSGTFPTVLSGRYVVGHGTGGLAGLHAVGPFSGSFAVATVGGRYHFD